jgi:RNA polymerase sigma-70 factor (ECF subfamily)
MADLILECKELQAEIDRAIESLPPQCKVIFLKSRMEGKSYTGIAQEQGIAVKTVEVQVSKALRIIRRRLEQYFALVFLTGVLFTYKSSLWQLFLL